MKFKSDAQRKAVWAKKQIKKSKIKKPLSRNLSDLHGLKYWVRSYQAARIAGNVRLAKEIYNNIEKRRKIFGFNKDEVYGSDPDKIKVEDLSDTAIGLGSDFKNGYGSIKNLFSKKDIPLPPQSFVSTP